MSNILEQIPLQILTGFLGSGKTTLLNKVVQNPDMKGTVLIINEVGEIGIDNKLISTDNPVILLDSGCICCSIQDGLVNVLHYLIEEIDNNNLEVNRVIIETTGIADPAPIIDLLFHYVDIECNYCYAGTITIVDGVNAKNELEKNYEAVKQIALADKIIISKTELISKEELDILNSTISDLNPTVEIYHSTLDTPPSDAFTNFNVFDTPKDIKSIMSWINLKRKDYKLASNMVATSFNSLSTKAINPHSKYTTLSFKYEKPLSRMSVIQTFDMINQTFGESVLRLKGIFDFDEGYPFVIHGVKGECYPISNQAEWEGKPFTEMVIICSPSISDSIKDMVNSFIKTI